MPLDTTRLGGEGGVDGMREAGDPLEMSRIAHNEGLSSEEMAKLNDLLYVEPGTDLKDLSLSVADNCRERALQTLANQDVFKEVTRSVIDGAATIEELTVELNKVPGIQGDDGVFYPGYFLGALVKKVADNALDYLEERPSVMKLTVGDFEGDEGRFKFGNAHRDFDYHLLPPRDFGLLEKVIELVNKQAGSEALNRLHIEANRSK